MPPISPRTDVSSVDNASDAPIVAIDVAAAVRSPSSSRSASHSGASTPSGSHHSYSVFYSTQAACTRLGSRLVASFHYGPLTASGGSSTWSKHHSGIVSASALGLRTQNTMIPDWSLSSTFKPPSQQRTSPAPISSDSRHLFCQFIKSTPKRLRACKINHSREQTTPAVVSPDSPFTVNSGGPNKGYT